MTKPIFWALAVSAAAAIWGVGLAEKLKGLQAPAPVAAAPATRTAALEMGPSALTLQADSRGHFAAEVSVDGRSLRMLVDTGATLCAFSEEDAERLGIRVSPRDFTSKTGTANGVVAVAPIRIPSVRIGHIIVRDVEAVVLPRGLLSTSLLGMSFLRRLSDVSMANGRLTLRG